jgi:hypothetical protein
MDFGIVSCSPSNADKFMVAVMQIIGGKTFKSVRKWHSIIIL